MKYSVVVPAFNEQEVLPLSYPRLKSVMDTLGDYEIIFVNDGSRDDTLKILKDIAAKDSCRQGNKFLEKLRPSGSGLGRNGGEQRTGRRYNRLRSAGPSRSDTPNGRKVEKRRGYRLRPEDKEKRRDGI